MCRRSNYWLSMDAHFVAASPPRGRPAPPYPLPETGVAYTSSATVFRGTEAEGEGGRVRGKGEGRGRELVACGMWCVERCATWPRAACGVSRSVRLLVAWGMWRSEQCCCWSLASVCTAPSTPPPPPNCHHAGYPLLSAPFNVDVVATAATHGPPTERSPTGATVLIPSEAINMARRIETLCSVALQAGRSECATALAVTSPNQGPPPNHPPLCRRRVGAVSAGVRRLPQPARPCGGHLPGGAAPLQPPLHRGGVRHRGGPQ